MHLRSSVVAAVIDVETIRECVSVRWKEKKLEAAQFVPVDSVNPWLALVRTCFIVDCVLLSIIGEVIFSSDIGRSVCVAGDGMAAVAIVDTGGGVVGVGAVDDDDELLPWKSVGDLKSFLGGMPSHTEHT